MLRFENLRAGYDHVERLHGVSAALSAGRLTAVIGPNGCGKSTLMKCAAGIIRPDSGEIRIDGRPLSAVTDRERARFVSYMPQSRLTPDIPVRQLVAHGRYPHLKWGQSLSKSDRAIVREALLRVELNDYADRSVSRLSGGERQRAYLAMMLAQQTPVMLLDEPTTYLDLSSQFRLMALLQSLCREGRCAAVVLHDLALAMEYADEILLMRDGELVAAGTPDAVCRSGRLQTVFGVEVERLPDGRFLFSPRRNESNS